MSIELRVPGCSQSSRSVLRVAEVFSELQKCSLSSRSVLRVPAVFSEFQKCSQSSRSVLWVPEVFQESQEFVPLSSKSSKSFLAPRVPRVRSTEFQAFVPLVTRVPRVCSTEFQEFVPLVPRVPRVCLEVRWQNQIRQYPTTLPEEVRDLVSADYPNIILGKLVFILWKHSILVLVLRQNITHIFLYLIHGMLSTCVHRAYKTEIVLQRSNIQLGTWQQR